MHTDNFVWGQSLNPFDKTRSCGGSSGGEGGIVAAQCAPLGIGTDIGGSIRVPCTFTGIRGFKPTSGRGSSLKTKSALKNNFTSFSHIKVAVGPLGKSVDDLKLAL